MGFVAYPVSQAARLIEEIEMTIQLSSTLLGTSKKVLEANLNAQAQRVRFYDPSVFTTREEFAGSEMEVGEKFPCVLDPAKRTRFATIERTKDGFKVR